MYDLILRGGTVYDGGGEAPFVADVAVQGAQIAAVGSLDSAAATATLDVAGQAVAPGFIDVHNHSEGWLLREACFAPKVSQGFTSEVLMSDGISYAPLTPQLAPEWLRYLWALNGLTPADYDGWQSLGDYLTRLDGRTAQNAAALIPYANVRVLAVGWGAAPLDEVQLRAVQRHIEIALADGAVGLSTGLDYISQCFSTSDELVAALLPLSGGRRPYVTHVRYKLGVVDGVREAVEIGRKARVPVHISHLKGANAAEAEALLDYIDRVAVHEVDFSFDVYPYLPGSTLLASLLPYEAWENGPLAAAARLRQPALRPLVAAQLNQDRRELERIRLAWLPSEKNRGLLGRSLAEVIAERGGEPADALCELLLEEELSVLCVFHHAAGSDGAAATVEEERRRDAQLVAPFLAHPRFMLGSDGIYQPYGPVHPRVYGSAPRLLALARAGSVGTLAETIRKMTRVPAERFGLAGRGRIEVGGFADLVVFDPQRVQDTATFAQPRQFSQGIACVVVNGTPVWRDGGPMAAWAPPGRALRE